MTKSDRLTTGVAILCVAASFLVGGPAWGFSLLFLGVVFIVGSSMMGDENLGTVKLIIPPPTETEKPLATANPDLIFVTFSTDRIQKLDKNVFLVHIRNDATSPFAVAKNVVAHIGYRNQSGSGMNVDYGAWMEHANAINFGRGATKRLIIGLSDEKKIWAVNYTGMRSDFKESSLVPVGQLTAQQWMMIIRINAEDYEKSYRFLLTVEPTGAVGCVPIQRLLW